MKQITYMNVDMMNWNWNRSLKGKIYHKWMKLMIEMKHTMWMDLQSWNLSHGWINWPNHEIPQQMNISIYLSSFYGLPSLLTHQNCTYFPPLMYLFSSFLQGKISIVPISLPWCTYFLPFFKERYQLYLFPSLDVPIFFLFSRKDVNCTYFPPLMYLFSSFFQEKISTSLKWI
jgi:hypothetical protein